MDNTSHGKQPVSMKLRLAHMNSNDVASKTKQLEEESKKMEDRLKELKLAMNKEKEARAQRGGGYWKSGKQGTLAGHAKEVLTTKPPSKPKSGEKTRKVKVLKDEPIKKENKTAKPGTLAFLAQRDVNKPSLGSGPVCGQCEIKNAIVTCQECNELYCSGCFTAFHLKGALAKHHSIPITSVAATPRGSITPRATPRKQPETKPQSRIVWDPPAQQVMSEPVMDSPSEEPTVTGGSLLDGTYDEREAAQSFQDALKEWRSGGTTETKSSINNIKVNTNNKINSNKNQERKKNVVVVSPVQSPRVQVDEGTSTVQPKVDYSPEFKQSELTYAERLLVKKNRRSEAPSLPDSRNSHLPSSEAELDGDGKFDTSTEQTIDFNNLMQALTPNNHITEYNQYNQIHNTSAIAIEEVFDDADSSIDEESHFIVETEQSSTFPSVLPAAPAGYNNLSFKKSSALHSSKPSARSEKAQISQSSIVIEELSDLSPTSKSTSKTKSAKSRNLRGSASKTSPTPSLSKPGTPTSRTERPSTQRRSQQTHKSHQKSAEKAATEKATSNQPIDESGDHLSNAADSPVLEPELKLLLRGGNSRPSSQMTSRSRASRRPKTPGMKSSRPKSRAEIAFEHYGDGGSLTTDPTPLRQIISQYQSTAPQNYCKTEHTDILDGFFTSGVEKPFTERTLTPRKDRGRTTPKSGETTLKKYHISNNVYKLSGARSWRPGSSVGDVDDNLTQTVINDIQNMQFDDGVEDITQTNDQPETTVRYTWSASHTRPAKNPIMKSVDPADITPRPDTADRLTAQLDSRERPATSDRYSPRVSSRPPTEVEQVTMGRWSPEVGKSRPSTKLNSTRISITRPLSARESSAIVVDGDDMTGYDDHMARNNPQDDIDDNDTMNDLELELASATGRLTADGRVSRLLLDEEADQGGDDSESIVSVTPRPTSPQTQRDIERLRESMMDDFEENEILFMQDEAMRVSLL